MRKQRRIKHRFSLDDMAHFVECAREGSMSAAARNLGVSVAAVSKSILGLERQLGVTLLVRTTRQMHLSESGKYFFERAVHILSLAQLPGLPCQHPIMPQAMVLGPDHGAGKLNRG